MIGELVRRLRLMGQASEIIVRQDRMLRDAVNAVSIWQDYALGTTRRFRDLAVAALIAQDQPEDDLRESLSELVESLEDEIARLEEYVCRD